MPESTPSNNRNEQLPKEFRDPEQMIRACKGIEPGTIYSQGESDTFYLADKNGLPLVVSITRGGKTYETRYLFQFGKTTEAEGARFLAVWSPLAMVPGIASKSGSNTLLKNVVDELGGAGFIPTTQSQPTTEPAAGEAPQTPGNLLDLPTDERLKSEVAETARAFLLATTKLLDSSFTGLTDQERRHADKFGRIVYSTFQRIGITEERIRALGENTHEPKLDGHGVALSRIKSLDKDALATKDPSEPYSLVSKLIITVWHSTQEFGPNQAVPDMDQIGRLIETIASIRNEINKLNRGDDTDFLKILRASGIEHIELHVGSWRSRAGLGKYAVRAPIDSAKIPKQ